jgi:hypothetical protein
VLIAAVALGVVCLLGSIELWLLAAQKLRDRCSVQALALWAVAVVWLLFNGYQFFCAFAQERTRAALTIRAIHLSSGVCPILPLLLASLGFLTSAVVNLNGLTLARDRDPQMPELPRDVKVGPTAAYMCDRRISSAIEAWGLLPGPLGLVLGGSVLIVYFVSRPDKMFQSVDGSRLSLLYVITFVLSLWTIGWLWARFALTWKNLRFMLELLEGSPLRFAFSRLPKVFSLTPIWSYAGLRRSVILPLRWFEYRRVASLAEEKNQSREELHKIWGGDHLDRLLSDLGDDLTLTDREYIRFSELQNDFSAELLSRSYVVNAWWRGGPDQDLPGQVQSGDTPSKSKGPTGSESYKDVPAPCGATDSRGCEVAISHEFVAMRFAAYIRYVTLQLKNLMTFMSMGFLFLLFAYVSYPFAEPKTIAWFTVALVGALLFGIGTVLIQMDRDPILSRLSETAPGEVDKTAFLKHMVTVGGLPLLTALSALFPSVGNLLFSWVRPLLEALH